MLLSVVVHSSVIENQNEVEVVSFVLRFCVSFCVSFVGIRCNVLSSPCIMM